MKIGHRRVASLLGGVLFAAGLILGGQPDALRAAGSDDPPQPAEVTPEEARENPDLPGFLDGQIDMEEYLQLRSDATSEYRGLPYSPGKKGPANPRAEAIKKMESQQQHRLQALTVGGLPPASWESLGPAPIPNGQTTTRSDPVSGRATAIAVHPTNPNKVYVGTAQGGVYRSLDGGATWTAIFDGAQSLAIGALAIAPSSPDTVYVGTGEPNLSSDSFFGVGLYRIDNAETTADLSGPINPAVTTGIAGTTAFTGRAISKILVHPTNPAIVFVATSSGVAGLGSTALESPAAVPPLAVLGLYRSTNATAASPSFEKLVVTNVAGTRLLAGDARTENSRIVDLVFDPGDPNIVLAAVYGGPAQGGTFNEGGLYRSTNALAVPPTFAKVTAAIATLNNAVRVSLAANKVGSTVTVVMATGESANFAGSSCTTGSGAVRKSTDGGVTWSARLPGGAGFCGTQCLYDQPIEIDPLDANLIHIGGASNSTCSRTYTRSTDGGATFVQTDDGLHADAHAIVAAPSNPAVVYEANDGGIWKSTDSGLTWTSLNNNGLNATQFQSLALHPVDREFMIGGTQDNGTEWRRPDASWTRADFGDGGFALIDQSATDTENVTMYHTYFNQTNAMGYGRVTRASDAFENNWTFFGCGFAPGTNGLNCAPAATSILFYAPMALGPGTPNTVYFGSDRLFRSSDQGATMVLASQGPIQSGVAVSAIGIAAESDSVRLVGMRLGRVYATATGASPLTDVTGPWPVSTATSQPRRFVSRAVIDPNDSNVAYVTFATYCGATANCAQVYKTTNLASALLAASLPTWTAASSGLPDVPVNAFVADPRNSSNLFAGTDIGVYNSTDGGASWAPYGTGLPRVAVFDMALHRPSGTLRAATHGRGLWEIAAGNASPAFSGLASPSIGLGGSPTLLSGFLAAGSLIPPGSVDITVNAVTQSAAIDPATGFFGASFDTSAYAAGAYPIDYAFAGATGYSAATGSGTLTVDAALAPTTTTLSAPTASFPDASVTVSVASNAGTPTGNVALRIDGGAALVQTLSGGSATFVLPTVEVGVHSLLATYAANPPFGGSAASGTLTVIPGTATFAVTWPRIAVGQTPSVLSGTLLSGTTVPTGSVGITLQGVTQSATIDPVTGAFSSSFATGGLAAGTYPIAVSYAGDASFGPSTGSGTLVVTAAVANTTFTNAAAITINDLLPASPSPSVINVSGLFGTVLKATVTLKGVSHTFFSDTAFLLVGPGGQTTALLYHAGPQVLALAGASNIDITIDDAAAAFPSGTAPPRAPIRPPSRSRPRPSRRAGAPAPPRPRRPTAPCSSPTTARTRTAPGSSTSRTISWATAAPWPRAGPSPSPPRPRPASRSAMRRRWARAETPCSP